MTRSTRSKLSFYALASAVFVIFALACVAGCSDQQRRAAQQAVAELQQHRDATTQASAEARAVLATLPANDPMRAEVQKRLDQLDAYIAKADKGLATATAVLNAKDVNDPMLDGLAGTFGPWGLLALVGIRWVNRELAASKNSKFVTELIGSIENAMPEKTDQQKAALAAPQSPELQALVAQLKTKAQLTAGKV